MINKHVAFVGTIGLVSIFLVVIGYIFLTQQEDQSQSTPEVPVIQSNQQDPQSQSENLAELIPLESQSSCVQHVLRYNGEIVQGPSDLATALTCATGVLQLSPDNQYLSYLATNTIKMYAFDSEQSSDLVTLEPNADGVSCVWAKNSFKLGCVSIHQESTPTKGIVYIMSFDDSGALVDKEQYVTQEERLIDFSCGSTCRATSFGFADDNSFQYRAHTLITSGDIYTLPKDSLEKE